MAGGSAAEQARVGPWHGGARVTSTGAAMETAGANGRLLATTAVGADLEACPYPPSEELDGSDKGRRREVWRPGRP
jgi:hypothetical protein